MKNKGETTPVKEKDAKQAGHSVIPKSAVDRNSVKKSQSQTSETMKKKIPESWKKRGLRIIKVLVHPKSWATFGIKFVKTFGYFFSFSFLLTVLMGKKVCEYIDALKFVPNALKAPFRKPLTKIYALLVSRYKNEESTISRVNLIELALRNMQFKKSRSVITIGGMSIGIAIIVFLVSIGFGLQDLVIGRVARLDELKQADVTIQTGSKLSIDDATLNSISRIAGVDKVLPLIAVVGRVNFNNSITDVAAYAVTNDYLNSSAIKPVRGKIFESNDFTYKMNSDEEETASDKVTQGAVAGTTSDNNGQIVAAYGERIQDIDFLINPEAWLRVREEPSTSARIIGYTRRTHGVKYGSEVWGSAYLSEDGAGKAGVSAEGQNLGRWIKGTFQLWNEEICLVSEDPDCEENTHVIMRAQDGSQVEDVGYVAEIDMSVRGLDNLLTDDVTASVLGESTEQGSGLSPQPSEYVAGEASDSAELVQNVTLDDISDSVSQTLNEYGLSASEAASLGIEELIASNAAGLEENIVEIQPSEEAIREAIVNRAMLAILGIDEADAVGQEFEVSFVLSPLLTGEEVSSRSVATTYTIIGVDPSADAPFFYVPFIDVRSLGASNYTQAKVVTSSEDILPKVRQEVEVLGYATSSVADTVDRINSFFASLRIVLALVGSVALAVASLGMFNTLTVSLLERTREVGLMKAMGMKSFEVQELFLTESLIMGFLGGVFGITGGILFGKFISLALTAYSATQGGGVIDISSTPFIFVILTLLFSFLVGLFTGIFPARRATKITALDALRYE